MNNKITLGISILLLSSILSAQNNTTKIQDMSDPLAVYTQAGIGATDKGINLKFGKAYDSGKPATMAMNILEIQGILGDTLGFRDDQVDSIDSIRFRNFIINTENGFGNQVDISWDFNKESGSVSYSIIQGLPKFWIINLYPLAGIGATIANDVYKNANGWADANSPSGISIPGLYVNLGMYSRIAITKKLWLNYNPVWLSSIGGSDAYKENTYGAGESSVFTHEFAVNYQIAPQFNVRYFGNWSNHIDFVDGGHRIEFNYQL